jgi:hypothetical protein
VNLDSSGVMMGAAWRVWYAHGFSSEQWVPVPVEDDVLEEGVLVVSEAVMSVACW